MTLSKKPWAVILLNIHILLNTHQMMFQDTHTKLMNNNPVVYYPWEPDFVSQYVHHQLRTDLPPHMQKKIRAMKHRGYGDFKRLNRTFYIDTTYNNDKKEVSYANLYSDTKVLSALLTSEKDKGSLLCHILSLYNPMQPHFKPINCYRQVFKTFIFEKLIQIQNMVIPIDTVISYARYGLMKCSNRQYVSTIHVCDGTQDCPDGMDELKCYGKIIVDNIYCSKTCLGKTNCTCLTLF